MMIYGETAGSVLSTDLNFLISGTTLITGDVPHSWNEGDSVNVENVFQWELDEGALVTAEWVESRLSFVAYQAECPFP